MGGVRKADSMDAALRLLLDGKALCDCKPSRLVGLQPPVRPTCSQTYESAFSLTFCKFLGSFPQTVGGNS